MTTKKAQFALEDDDDRSSIRNLRSDLECATLGDRTPVSREPSYKQSSRSSSPHAHGALTSLGSAPGSRQGSISEAAFGSNSRPHSRIHTPDVSPPSTPRNDPEDPYRRSARVPQSKSLADIAPQFIFQKHAPVSSHTSHSSHSSHSTASHSHGSHLHLKDFFHHHHSTKEKEKDRREKGEVQKHHSGFDLGKFFRHGHGRRSGHATPSSSSAASVEAASHSSSTVHMDEFDHKVPKKVKGDDHQGFHQKYGKAGRLLGSGAGGSVRIVKRLADGRLFAVKEFRERGTTESQKDYNKKVTAEFCVASAMHHSNVIETIEVLKENAKWYQVMEYAPFDMFAIVMTGRMERTEVFCCFKQLLRGVEYLHGMGLAHRDLKLDNLVVDEHGIVKIIDFGSAFVFRYPFEEDVQEATGIVGSDPYLSPEVCTQTRYQPEAADIWSCAIIFCCMWLRRFPWKSPRLTDNSFKNFSAPDANAAALCELPNLAEAQTESQQSANASDQVRPVRGPWRLLRLLPRESRAVLKGMLQMDPANRFRMQDIVADDWIQTVDMCYEDKQHGQVHKSQNHNHTLVGPETAPSKAAGAPAGKR